MKIKKSLWLIPLVLGLLPFLWALIGGLYAAINGFSGLAVLGTPYYGWSAFVDWVFLFSFVAWWSYLIGGGLIVLAVCMLRRKS
jgi:hypothetical protein